MVKAWHLGTAFGIKLYLHWSVLLLPLLVLIPYSGAPLNVQLFYVAVVAALFGCVLLHELGHALTARRFGIQTRDITLYPIGGVARLERMSEKPWEEFWIALGGPAVNVVIAGILLGVLVTLAAFAPELLADDQTPTTLSSFLAHLLMGNVVLVVFNMLPAFPMDGGRVLRALLSLWLGQLQATRIAASLGVVIVVLMGVGGYWYLESAMPMAVGVFVLFAGQQELWMLELRHRQQHQRESEVEASRPLPEPGTIARPTTTVYAWDERAGGWVPQRAQPAPFTWM